MSGTAAGAAKAAQTNKKLYGSNYYARIGKIGGENGYGYGFAHGRVSPATAGKRGGKLSKRALWRPVKGYENLYEVSATGRIRRVGGYREALKPRLNTAGYHTVALCSKGIKDSRYIHRLVAQAFIPNPDNLPQTNHKDGDRGNNSVLNLEWCTPAENYNHAIQTGLRKYIRDSKPECSRGHVFRTGSYFRNKRNIRVCRECKRQNKQKYLEKQKGKLDPSKTGKLGGAGNRRGGWSAERKAAHSRFMKDYWRQRQPFVPDDSEFGEGLLEPSWKDRMLNKLRSK